MIPFNQFNNGKLDLKVLGNIGTMYTLFSNENSFDFSLNKYVLLI